MRKRHVGMLCAALLAWLACQAAADPWSAPTVDGLANDAWGRAVRQGRDLIVRTPELIGPEVADPAGRFAGNNLSCQSCHLDAGTSQFALPLVGVFADFPQYRGREGRVGTVEDRINGCMTRSLNGRELPVDGPEMRAMVAYLKFLSTGIPVGAKTAGRGTAPVPLLERAADPAHGAAVYGQTCAVCHGADGAGKRIGTVGDGKGYEFPPLWGPDSFNDGAGMARLITSTGFIRGNMPRGVTWETPALTPEDAWDVAAFVDSQPRPRMEGLDRDYPKLVQKPVDVPYGPYADHFSQEQHRLGPFRPIKEAVRQLLALENKGPADPVKSASPTKH